MGRRSLSFCCLRLCFELALVTLCRQQSSVIHMHMDPSCLLQRCPAFEHVSGLFSPPTLPWLFCLYCISITGALFPLCVRAHGWVPGIASHGSSLIEEQAANSGSSWMSRALNLHLVMLLLMSGKLHCLVWSLWQPWAFW